MISSSLSGNANIYKQDSLDGVVIDIESVDQHLFSRSSQFSNDIFPKLACSKHKMKKQVYKKIEFDAKIEYPGSVDPISFCIGLYTRKKTLAL